MLEPVGWPDTEEGEGRTGLLPAVRAVTNADVKRLALNGQLNLPRTGIFLNRRPWLIPFSSKSPQGVARGGPSYSLRDEVAISLIPEACRS